MSESKESQNELNDFADALRSLVPLPSAFSRDELMFRAGQASVERSSPTIAPRRWLWPLLAAACTLVAATLGMRIGEQNAEPKGQFVQRATPAAEPDSVEVRVPPATPTLRPSTDYLAERNRMLARGVDSLPASGVRHDTPTSNPSYFELRDGLLHRDRS